MALFSTENIIKAALHKFRAPRRTKTVSTVAGTFDVHLPGEKILYLPNGTTVKVTTDESDHATQIEEDEALHAIARPESIRYQVMRSNA